MKENDKNELLRKLANRVKMLRQQKGITQEDALNDTGIHFGRIEQGKRDISFTTLHKICIYFEISLEDFFTNDFK
ncbi:helix-turn-helix domain-containing protein [Aquimarina aggregata]|uniref:helix-turn-helix domain-containing protein n=2 Tax=Aquimarina TaxID=290174 RepID=UPI0024907278|nr:helix-turn-helix transcriptional regulator [Aquimarina aggregata]